MRDLMEFAAALCQLFGLPSTEPRGVAPVGRGAVGEVWRLDVGEARYAVKEFFWGTDEATALREVAFRDQAVARGVRAPDNIRSRDGRYVCDLPGHLSGHQVRLYTWLDGDPVSADAPMSHAWIGEVLGRLHAMRATPTGEPHPWYEVCPGEREWDELLRSAVAVGVPWSDSLAEALPAIVELTAMVTPTPRHEIVTSHLDLQPSNVLYDRDGPLILDWDNTGPTSPERELGFVLAHWHVRNGSVDQSGVARTVRAYRAFGGSAELDGDELFVMWVATHLNFVHVQALLALDKEASPMHRQEATARVVDGLAQLPGPAQFAALYEAATIPGGER